jgi:hypothetical protein
MRYKVQYEYKQLVNTGKIQARSAILQLFSPQRQSQQPQHRPFSFAFQIELVPFS